jgi:Trk K+ transport system NAD-binding subunit
VKRWVLPTDDSLSWSDDAGTIHLVERILPDHLAGRPLKDLNVGHDVSVVGVVRGGKGRLDAAEIFAQEDDTVTFMVTNKGLAELNDILRSQP